MSSNEKELFKEAIKEWLDERVRDFGYWSLRTVGSAAFIALIYLLVEWKFLK